MSNVNYYYINKIFLIQAAIRDYKNNLINLQNLITKIEELLDLLENYDALWCQEIKSLWFSLEIKYAMVLSENRSNFSTQEEQEIEKVVDEISQIIEKKVKDIPEDYWYQKYY